MCGGRGEELLRSTRTLAVATLITASQARTETLLFAVIPQKKDTSIYYHGRFAVFFRRENALRERECVTFSDETRRPARRVLNEPNERAIKIHRDESGYGYGYGYGYG